MFPLHQLTEMVRFTNAELRSKTKRETTKSELLKLFGVMILITKHEFTSQAQLWSTVAQSKYQTAALFGKTGMSRNRFDNLFTNLHFGHQPIERPAELSVEQYWWLLVENFVNNFNNHQESSFIPSNQMIKSRVNQGKISTDFC